MPKNEFLPASDLTPQEQISLFLSMNFHDDESVKVVTIGKYDKNKRTYKPYEGGRIYKVDELKKQLAQNKPLEKIFPNLNRDIGAWIGVNPTTGTTAKDVTAGRNVLVECDHIPREQQIELYKKVGLDHVTLTDSGGKSIHAILKIQPTTDPAEYEAACESIYAALELKGVPVDHANKNLARLTRLPGVSRKSGPQRLISVNPTAKETDYKIFDAEREFNEAAGKIAKLEGQTYGEGERHTTLVRYAASLFVKNGPKGVKEALTSIDNFNENNLIPPLESDEVQQVTADALRWAKNNVWPKATYNAPGKKKSNYLKLVDILRTDKKIPRIRLNQLTNIIEYDTTQPLPWGMADYHVTGYWDSTQDAGLDYYISESYGFDPRRADHDRAIRFIAGENCYHPVKKYFDELPEWDGIERAETVFCDYLGAPDNAYVRGITKYTLSACVQRLYKPGIKWDYMPILIGDQGCGKSTILRRLAVMDDAFTDGLKVSMMGTVQGIEQITGAWIVEVSEMAGLKKSEEESVKAFLSHQKDRYRIPYEKQATDLPRQCVIFGTTNERDGILRDQTGGRRYFPIALPPKTQTEKRGWFLDQDTVKQIWAEVLAKWKDLTLELPADLAQLAEEIQKEETVKDPAAGIIELYLDMPVPAEWNTFTVKERRYWFEKYQDPNKVIPVETRGNIDSLPADGIIMETCLKEVWECALGQDWDPSRARMAALNLMRQVDGWKKSDKPRKLTKFFGKQTIYKRDSGGK